MDKQPRILLVMHDVPLSSGFLATKFLRLAAKLDTSLLVWDSKKNIQTFIRKYNLDTTIGSKIHSGITSIGGVMTSIFTFLSAVLLNNKLRQYIFAGEGAIAARVKFVMLYLPVFKLKPDIIHFEFGTLAKQAALLKRLTAAKTIVSFRGYDINYIGLDQPGYYDDLWQHIDAIHFLGNDLKKRAISRGYKGDKQEAIIAPAIDVEHFTTSKKAKVLDKLTIVSVGRLVWKKGYDLGIRTMAELKQKGIPFEYHIVGNGEQLQALQFIKRELGLDSEVVIAGDKTSQEVKEILNSADVFLHPAISEGFCNAVLEAQSMGLPVICSDADGLPENVVDGITGFVVPKWDVNAMADRLEWLWNNKNKINEMGEAGIKRVQEHFRVEDQISKFERFYKGIHG